MQSPAAESLLICAATAAFALGASLLASHAYRQIGPVACKLQSVSTPGGVFVAEERSESGERTFPAFEAARIGATCIEVSGNELQLTIAPPNSCMVTTEKGTIRNHEFFDTPSGRLLFRFRELGFSEDGLTATLAYDATYCLTWRGSKCASRSAENGEVVARYGCAPLNTRTGELCRY